MEDHAPLPGDSTVADLHGCAQNSVAADKYVLTDVGAALGAFKAVVGSDSARADVRVLADARIAYVAEMAHVNARLQGGADHFGVVAQIYPFHEVRARTQVAVRPHRDPVLNDTPFEG